MRKIIALLLVAATPFVAGAQRGQWRTVEVARQLNERERVRADIDFGNGSLEIAAAPEGLLYQMQLHYDESRTDAVHEYDANSHSLRLGMLRPKGKVKIGGVALGRRHSKDGEEAKMTLGLSRAIPFYLDIRLGGGEGEIELGGLKIEQLHLATGAGEAKIRFSELNEIEMDEMTLQVGAAGIEVENLGNANVGQIRVQGGAGGVKLDFGESIARDVVVNSEVALGALQIEVPEDVGVSIKSRTVLGGFDASGYTKVGDEYFSDNWSTAARKVTVRASTVLGGLEVNRVGR